VPVLKVLCEEGVRTLKYLLLAFLLFFTNVYGQDSVISYWEEIINSKELERADFVKLARQAEVELLLINFYLDTCQENLAIKAAKHKELKSHLKVIGSEIVKYNKSVKPDELSGYKDRIYEYYLSQKQTLPKDIASSDRVRKEGFCNNVRTEVQQLKKLGAPLSNEKS